MGIFSGNYEKPGRGISKEEAQKRSYFGILGRKYSKIIQSSLVYSLANIVIFAAFVFLLIPLVVPVDEASRRDIAIYFILLINAKAPVPISIFIPFMFIGPSVAGLTYVTRNFARQEPTFVWSDFRTNAKKNFRQAIITSIIMTLVSHSYITAVIYYFNAVANYLVVLLFAIIIGLLLMIVSFYVFPIMVTFDMKLVDIFRNSILMTFMNLPKNLLVAGVTVAINVMLILFAPPLWMFLSVVFLFGWTSYTTNYVAWEAIDKYMMPKK